MLLFPEKQDFQENIFPESFNYPYLTLIKILFQLDAHIAF